MRIQFFRHTAIFGILTLILLFAHPGQAQGIRANNISHSNQISSISASTAIESQLWSGWKHRFALKLAKGTVIRDPYSGAVFSEAMGHAMLLAIQFDDAVFFNQLVDGLNEYFTNSHGLYAWKIMATGAQFPESDNQASASESELNILVALIQAEALVKSGQWKMGRDYEALASSLEGRMWQYEILTQADQVIFLPSDNKANQYWPRHYENGASNPPLISYAPTYFNPAFIKMIANRFPAHNWKGVLDTSYALMERIITDSDRLLQNDQGIKGKNPVPAWVYLKYDNTAHQLLILNYFKNNTYNPFSNEYDSIRVPMYVGLDYFWNQNAQARTIIERFLSRSKVSSVAAAESGAQPGFPNGFCDELAISQYGVANKVIGNGEPFLSALETLYSTDTASFGTRPDVYYHQTFALYGYLVLRDRFRKIAN